MGKTHCVQYGRRILHALCVRVFADKTRIERGIVRDHGGIAAKRKKARQHPFNRRGVSHHRVIDSGQLLDAVGNRQFRIHKLREAVHNFSVLHLHRADFNDAVFSRRETGGLNIKDHEAVIERALARRNHELF